MARVPRRNRRPNSPEDAPDGAPSSGSGADTPVSKPNALASLRAHWVRGRSCRVLLRTDRWHRRYDLLLSSNDFDDEALAIEIALLIEADVE